MNDLMQIKMQLYFAAIERANCFIDIKTNPQLKEYLSAVECLMNGNEIQIEVKEIMNEVVNELESHQKLIQCFVNQMIHRNRCVELVLDNCAKDSSFEDIFGAHFVYSY